MNNNHFLSMPIRTVNTAAKKLLCNNYRSFLPAKQGIVFDGENVSLKVIRMKENSKLMKRQNYYDSYIDINQVDPTQKSLVLFIFQDAVEYTVLTKNVYKKLSKRMIPQHNDKQFYIHLSYRDLKKVATIHKI